MSLLLLMPPSSPSLLSPSFSVSHSLSLYIELLDLLIMCIAFRV